MRGTTVRRILIALLSGFAVLCNVSQAADLLIRQQKTVIVDGVEETWQLR
jgi:hypothetical protein